MAIVLLQSWLLFIFSKVGKIKPATRSIAMEVIRAAYANGHKVRFLWGMSLTGSEHPSGRAIDFMVYDREAGDFIRNYIWNMRKRHHLRHVIWWQHITSTVVQPGKVRLMADRGSTTENHKDHVHAMWFDYEYEAPAVTDRHLVAYPGHQHWEKGKDDHHVEQIQKRLTQLGFYKGAIDGKFGPQTGKGVRAFQKKRGLTVDGYVGRKTWGALNIYNRAA